MKTTLNIICISVAFFLLPQPAFSQVGKALLSHMESTTPDGDGPFPAIMMISGCSGFSAGRGYYDDTQARLTKLGFYVVRVDSLGARGEGRCDGGDVSTDDQVADVQAVAAHLNSMEAIKKGSINVLGWSWGGGEALAAAIAGEGFDAAIAYYPACKRVPEEAVKIPTLVLFGQADNVADIDICGDIFSASKALTLRTYPDAHHAFDNPYFDPPKEYRFGTIGYNEPAAKAAWAELEQFLRR